MKNLTIEVQGEKLPIMVHQGIDNNTHFAEILFQFRNLFELYGFEGFTEYKDDDKDYFTHDICEFISDVKEDNNKIITKILINDKIITVTEILDKNK